MRKMISKLLAAGVLLVTSIGGTASAASTYDLGSFGDGDGLFQFMPFVGVYGINDTFNFTLEEKSVVTLTYALLSSGANNGIVGPGLGLMSYEGHDASGALLDNDLAPTNGLIPASGNYMVTTPILLAGDYSQVITGAFMPNGGAYSVNIAVSAVPVPGAAILFGSAVVAFGFISRRRKGISS